MKLASVLPLATYWETALRICPYGLVAPLVAGTAVAMFTPLSWNWLATVVAAVPKLALDTPPLAALDRL